MRLLSPLVFCLTLAACLAAGAPSLRVGVAKTVITPQEPVQLAGYASRKELSTGVHDDISARALVFETGGSRLALVSLDLIGFYGNTAEALRTAIVSRTGLTPYQLFLCAIHTHAAPSPGLDPQAVHANNVRFTEGLKGKLAELVANAIANLQPATLSVGIGSSPVGANRRELRINAKGESSIVLGRNPYGPTDKEVQVLRMVKADGSPLAVAFDYATHGTSLGPANLIISGDVLGLAEQMIERVTDSGGVALAFVGASGNIDPWYRILPAFNTEPGWTPEPVLLGNLLGQEVVHVYRRSSQLEAPEPIRSSLQVIQLPAKVAAGSSPQPVAERLPYTITAARIGDVGIIGLGGEVLTEIGQAIKAGSPFRHTLVITHCNGAAGYLAPRHLYLEGGYEVQSTRFSPDAAQIVVRESLRLLHGLL
ncbi:MAG: neutral/alkaline non-lysosomal ceramidase N-terminal domain-containing protein [Acidobacteriota bacterium]